VDAKGGCGGAEVFVERSKRERTPARQLKIGGVVHCEPETVGEQQRFRPCVRIGVGVGRNVEQRQIIERRPGNSASMRPWRTATVRLLATSSRQSAGTSAPASATPSNSRRIASVVSSLYIQASVAELSSTKLMAVLDRGRPSTRTN